MDFAKKDHATILAERFLAHSAAKLTRGQQCVAIRATNQVVSNVARPFLMMRTQCEITNRTVIAWIAAKTAAEILIDPGSYR